MFKFPSFFSNRLTILDRYLFRQFFGPFVMAVAGFSLIAMVDILMYFMELAIVSRVPVLTVLRLLLYKLPALMVIFFPMAVLFATMLLLIRMAKDNEITILRASGIHYFRFLLPVLLFAGATSYLSYLTNEKVVPWTNHTSDAIIREQIQKTPPPEILENTVFKDSENRYFYINKSNPQDSSLEGVLIFEPADTFCRVTTAKRAQYKDTAWILQNGFVQEYGPDGAVEFTDQFSELVIHVDSAVNQMMSRQKTPKEMDSTELREKIDVLQKGGLSTDNLKVEYYMKQSLPIACFIFGLVGIAFCLTFVRSGKDWWGVIVAICVSVLTVGFYLFMMALFRAFALNGHLTPFWGAWLPNLIYGSIGLVLLVYQSTTR